MTYRERREARAERLHEWADKRAAAAAALHARNEPYRGDIAFNTQPGPIPERARVIRRTERAWEHTQKAVDMNRRADTIETQAAGAIYSDDPDAIERLRERIAGLEAERDRIKAYNVSCRRGQPDESLLDEEQRENLASVRKHAPYQIGKGGAFPAYALSNLNGNLGRQRERLAALVDVGPAIEEPATWGPEHFRPGDQAQNEAGRWLPVHRVEPEYLEMDYEPDAVRRDRWPYAIVAGRRRPPDVAVELEERRAELSAPAPPVRVVDGPDGQLALMLVG